MNRALHASEQVAALPLWTDLDRSTLEVLSDTEAARIAESFLVYAAGENPCPDGFPVVDYSRVELPPVLRSHLSPYTRFDTRDAA